METRVFLPSVDGQVLASCQSKSQHYLNFNYNQRKKMKKIYLIVIISSLFNLSCNRANKLNDTNSVSSLSDSKCLSGFILIDYLGDQTKPIKSLLIRTDSKDSSYYKYFWQKSALTDPYVRMMVLKDIVINQNEYMSIKKYILNNNTHKNEICVDKGFNSLLVRLMDKCDTLEYVVDRTNDTYFQNILNVVTNNDALRKDMEYLRRVQERRWDDQ